MAKKISKTPSEKVLSNTDQRRTVWCSGLVLLLIVLFAVFLRYEDFSVWKENKNSFQYRGEYQMANFDSYYYLQIAKELQRGDYDNLQENRRVPNGTQTPAIPPLIAFFAASVSSLTGIPVSTVAIFIPVLLAPLLAPLVFLIAFKLSFNRQAALTAALFSIISVTYVARTRIGVFDTDCLNVVFVLLNSYLFFCFAEIKNNKRYTYFGLGLLNSFLFFIWWNTAASVVMLSALVPLSVALIFFYKTKKVFIKYSFLVLTFSVSTYFTIDQITALFNLIFDTVTTDFPKNMSISELDTVSLNSFIKRTSNNTFIFISMVFGMVLLCLKLKLKMLFFAIPVMLAFSPFFAGSRFILFSAPVLALGIGYCIQMLFHLKAVVKTWAAVGITVLMVFIGIISNYKIITYRFAKPAAYENTVLLNALNEHTPEDANIWTDWDLGYQIQYYLERGTYADGGFSDGEISYYASFPLAADNLEVSANFMRFYNKHGVKGMNVLYESFSGVENTFNFLRELLSLSPSEAAEWFVNRQKKNQLPKTNNLTTPQQWTAFLFPRESEDIYVFIHYKMTQTAAWFKQGSSDLKTGQTKGLPLFLTFNSLQEQTDEVKNNQIRISTKTGVARYLNQPRYFQSLSTFNGAETTTKTFGKRGNSGSFVFQWNKKVGFGAAMSEEMANTTLVKLYLLQEKSPHFQPILINMPQYQLWKVSGNAYGKN